VLGLREARRADVYNLTVEGEPEFFANGVLVHNCDALRYLLMTVGTEPIFPIFGDASSVALREAAVQVGHPVAQQMIGPFALIDDPYAAGQW
jgi:hypothetical protein